MAYSLSLTLREIGRHSAAHLYRPRPFKVTESPRPLDSYRGARRAAWKARRKALKEELRVLANGERGWRAQAAIEDAKAQAQAQAKGPAKGAQRG